VAQLFQYRCIEPRLPPATVRTRPSLGVKDTQTFWAKKQCQGGRGPTTQLVHDRGDSCGRLRGKIRIYPASTIGILTGSFAVGRRDCRLVGGNGEREFCDQIRQQGVDSSHPVAHCAGDCRYVGSFAELAINYNGLFCKLCDGCQCLRQGSTDVEQRCCHRFYDRK